MCTNFSLMFLITLIPSMAVGSTTGQDLSDAAISRTHQQIRYDGKYVSIDYPGGDVPSDIGVCSDVVIRSYRAIGTDLQVLVHEDMSRNFGAYLDHWGLKKPDSNIDHRRVPNLQIFFTRHGQVLGIGKNPQDYVPGDMVTWILPGNRPHIGVVTDKLASSTGNPMLAHNVGSGPKLEDVLFAWPITGHYRFTPTPN